MAPTRAEGKHLPSWVKFVRTDTAPARCSSTTVHVRPCSLPHSEPRVTHRAPRGHDALIGNSDPSDCFDFRAPPTYLPYVMSVWPLEPG